MKEYEASLVEMTEEMLREECVRLNTELDAAIRKYLEEPAPSGRREPYSCPVCGGKGAVQPGFYSLFGWLGTTVAPPETCRSCDGSGVIWSI
jgi:DnaJ-class molecular chaperone